jgi:hypothetical protein
MAVVYETKGEENRKTACQSLLEFDEKLIALVRSPPSTASVKVICQLDGQNVWLPIDKMSMEFDALREAHEAKCDLVLTMVTFKQVIYWWQRRNGLHNINIRHGYCPSLINKYIDEKMLQGVHRLGLCRAAAAEIATQIMSELAKKKTMSMNLSPGLMKLIQNSTPDMVLDEIATIVMTTADTSCKPFSVSIDFMNGREKSKATHHKAEDNDNEDEDEDDLGMMPSRKHRRCGDSLWSQRGEEKQTQSSVTIAWLTPMLQESGPRGRGILIPVPMKFIQPVEDKSRGFYAKCYRLP